MVKKPSFALPTHRSSLFTSMTAKDWVVEASDFGPAAWKARVWDDAADVGFYVLEATERRKTLFTEVSAVHKDGELELWVFQSEDGTTITVSND